MAQLRISLVYSTTPAHGGGVDVYAIALHVDPADNRVPGDPSQLRFLHHEMTRLPWPTSQAAGAH